MGNSRSTLGDLNLFSKGGVFTSEQLDEYQVPALLIIMKYSEPLAKLNFVGVVENFVGVN